MASTLESVSLSKTEYPPKCKVFSRGRHGFHIYVRSCVFTLLFTRLERSPSAHQRPTGDDPKASMSASC